MHERQEIKSLKKALRALTYMNQKGEASVSSVAVEIGVPRTTALRLLETLTSEGYVRKIPNSRYYRITDQVLQLASGFQGETVVVQMAAPRIAELGKEVGWPITLATPRGSEMIVRLTTNFDTTMVLERFMVGYGLPILHATTGLCFLAFCSEPERETALELARATDDPRDKLAHDPTRLEAILSRIRERGFCWIEYPEYREGNVAVPLTVQGRVVGGIVMRYIKNGMRSRKMQEYYVPLLKERSRDIQLVCEAHLNNRLDRRSEAAPRARSGVRDLECLDIY